MVDRVVCLSEPEMSNTSEKVASLSVDLDSIACYREIHGLRTEKIEGSDAAYSVGVERLLDFLDDLRIPATLFVIGRDAEVSEHQEILKRAHSSGHELASHSYSHDYALRLLDEAALLEDFQRVEDILHTIQGRRPVGFRAPGYNIDNRLLKICTERGYAYDSSVFPCPPYYAAKGAVMAWLAMRGRPSRSSMTRAEALVAPLQPYHPAVDQFWRAGDLPIVEIPMAVVPLTRFPVIGTSLHVLKEVGFDAAFRLLKRQPFLNLEFHAIDFMDFKDRGTAALLGHQPDLKVPWQVKRARYAHVVERVKDVYRFETLEVMAQSAKASR